MGVMSIFVPNKAMYKTFILMNIGFQNSQTHILEASDDCC